MQNKHTERKFRNILLMGLPGSGKTSFGKTFAYLSGRSFLDFDRFVENVAGKSIPQIFATEGEAGFRDLEFKCLRKLGRYQNHVIALGGGTLCSPQTMNFAKNMGYLVFLERSLESVASEIFRSMSTIPRPLFSDCKTIEAVKKKVEELWEQRKNFYEEADLILHSGRSSVDCLALELQLLERKAFHREYQRLVAAVGRTEPPHFFPQGNYFMPKRRGQQHGRNEGENNSSEGQTVPLATENPAGDQAESLATK